MTKHELGTFCWADLASTAQDAAKRFYGDILGWRYEDVPLDGGMSYSMATLAGKQAAAVGAMDPAQAKQGVPSHWNQYVMVENAEATAERAQRLGGKIIAPAFDVMDAGRMAVIQDPTGAMVSVWQAKKHQGAEVVRETGSVCWNELLTGDPEKAAGFYGELFGWTAKTELMGSLHYTLFSKGEEQIGGMMKLDPAWGPVPPHWLVYFAVKSCDGTVAQVIKQGGKCPMPAFNIPDIGRVATLFDPQGAVFAILEPAEMK